MLDTFLLLLLALLLLLLGVSGSISLCRLLVVTLLLDELVDTEHALVEL